MTTTLLLMLHPTSVAHATPFCERPTTVFSDPAWYRHGHVSDVGDITGDGVPDVVMSGLRHRADLIWVDGATGQQHTVSADPLHGYADWYFPATLSVGDADGDGFADVVATMDVWTLEPDWEGSVGFEAYAFHGGAAGLDPTPGLHLWQEWWDWRPLGWRVVADVDGDGDAELVSRDQDAGLVIRYGQPGGLPLVEDAVLGAAAGHGQVFAADVDGDGHRDLVRPGGGGILVLPGGTDGLDPGAQATLEVGTGLVLSPVPDVDGDGDAEVAALQTTGADPGWILRGSPAGLTADDAIALPFPRDADGDTFRMVALEAPGDVNGDGTVELVGHGADADHDVVVLGLADSSATVVEQQLLRFDDAIDCTPAHQLVVKAVHAGHDFTGDGRSDVLVVVGCEDEDVQLWVHAATVDGTDCPEAGGEPGDSGEPDDPDEPDEPDDHEDPDDPEDPDDGGDAGKPGRGGCQVGPTGGLVWVISCIVVARRRRPAQR